MGTQEVARTGNATTMVDPRQMQERKDPVTELKRVIQNESVKRELTMALPAHVDKDKFIRVVLTAVTKNPDLAVADRSTLFNSCVECAADGLMPNGKEAALVIFNTKVKRDGREIWVKAVQYMPMIRGLYKLARNSGEVASLSAHVVHAKDEFFYAYGFDIDLKHVPHMGEDRGDAIAVYAAVVLKDGSRDLEVMSVSDVEKVRSVSKTGKSGPWVQWWDEMARKTVMRRMLKRVPMSEDVERAIERDNAFYEMERRRNEPPAIQGPANTAEVIDYGTEAGWGSTAIDHDHETGEIQSEGDDGDQEEDATGEPEAEETSEPEQQEEGAAVSTPTADKPQATKAKPAAAKGGANSNLFPE